MPKHKSECDMNFGGDPAVLLLYVQGRYITRLSESNQRWVPRYPFTDAPSRESLNISTYRPRNAANLKCKTHCSVFLDICMYIYWFFNYRTVKRSLLAKKHEEVKRNIIFLFTIDVGVPKKMFKEIIKKNICLSIK